MAWTYIPVNLAAKRNSFFSKPFLQLICYNDNCNRELLCRWFETCVSIFESSDAEVLKFFERFPYASLVVSTNTSVSVVYKLNVSCVNGSKRIIHEDLKLHVPVVIGTQLWFMCNSLKAGSVISLCDFIQYRIQMQTIYCPFCCFHRYIPLGCFTVGKRLAYMPLFAAVDSSRVHSNRETLRAFVDNIAVNIPDNLVVSLHETISQWTDCLSNYSFHTATRIFFKLLSDVVESPLCLLKSAKINYELSFDTLKIISNDVCINRLRKKLLQKSADFNANILVGNVTQAISKNTKFKTTEIGGQTHESDRFTVPLREAAKQKSELEARHGYYRPSSRYLYPNLTDPVTLAAVVLHIVKLISKQVITSTHQCLHGSFLNFFCIHNTVDNKNSGMHLELLPGVKLVNKHNVDEDDQVFLRLRRAARFLLRNYPDIQKEYCHCPLNKISHEDTLASNIVEALAYQSCVKNCKCTPLISSIKLYGRTMKEYNFNEHFTPRFDILVIAVCLSKSGVIPLDIYYTRKAGIGLIRTSTNSLLDERFSITPGMREWLLAEYYDAWNLVLSPKIDGNVIMQGFTANQASLINHSASAKVSAGLCGIRHAAGLPLVAAGIDQFVPRKSLLYPQNDMSRFCCVSVPSQLAVLCITALRGDNVEDGIVVSKHARDRGFGMTESHTIISVQVIFTDEINICVPIENGEVPIAFTLNKQRCVNEAGCIDIQLSNWYRRRSVKPGSFLFDVSGVNHVSSYMNIAEKVVDSAARFVYADRFACGTIEGNMRVTGIRVQWKKMKVIHGNVEATISVNFVEVRLLECGDKFSTLEGQKATVVKIAAAEDLPFFSGSNKIPPQCDIFCNISMEKRQTLGLDLSGIVRAYKCHSPHVDITSLHGEQSVGHHNFFENKDCDIIGKLVQKALVKTRVTLYDGCTGRRLGPGNVMIVPFIRYVQEGAKTAHYVANSDDFPRSVTDDFLVKGRGNLGGMKHSQSNAFHSMASGSIDAFDRMQHLQSQPRNAASPFSKRVTPAFCNVINTFAVNGLEIIPES